jgi:hypothetical protein
MKSKTGPSRIGKKRGLLALLCKLLIINGPGELCRTLKPGWPAPGGKDRFLGHRQENILDTEAPGTRFDQCLQGFRILKISVIMTCTNSSLYAIMRQ